MKEAKTHPKKQAIHYRCLECYNLKISWEIAEEKLTAFVMLLCWERRNSLLYLLQRIVWYNSWDFVIGHRGRTRMIKESRHQYKNVTIESIMVYLRSYKSCQKKQKMFKKVFVVKPILHTEKLLLNRFHRYADGFWQHIQIYSSLSRAFMTKFVLLQAVQRAKEVTYNLDVFTTFRTPSIFLR